ncbi:MAG TPA: twin-arginine translocation signal domain-containing protein, partial [Cyclobacteriaceae bacterium]|nr:twin-arginine translocation signal domain-containing protein [Cyclobacteriaceae bacterium]
MKKSRREFLKRSALATAGVYLGAVSFDAKSYARILGSNDRVRVGVVGFSDRFKYSLFPAFQNHHRELDFDIVGVSDIWKIRREEGQQHIKEKLGHDITGYR